jgi:hypothetical protein
MKEKYNSSNRRGEMVAKGALWMSEEANLERASARPEPTSVLAKRKVRTV